MHLEGWVTGMQALVSVVLLNEGLVAPTGMCASPYPDSLPIPCRGLS